MTQTGLLLMWLLLPDSSKYKTYHFQGYIVVGYRGTFAFGRDMSDVKFRKLTRILVHGKVNMCKEVFKNSLNDSRDPDRGQDGDRYTARYFLKHTVLEQAFDQLCEAGFRMVGSCASGTSAPNDIQEIKPGQVILKFHQIVHLFLFRYSMAFF